MEEMKSEPARIVLTIVCLLGLSVTILADGWWILLLGIGFLLVTIMQFIIIWKSSTVWDQMKRIVKFSTILLFTFFLFREDFGDGHISLTNPIMAIMEKLGMVESSYYGRSTVILGLLNAFIIFLLPFQVFWLIKIRKLKKKLPQ